jgi:hypothetical protein
MRQSKFLQLFLKSGSRAKVLGQVAELLDLKPVAWVKSALDTGSVE